MLGDITPHVPYVRPDTSRLACGGQMAARSTGLIILSSVSGPMGVRLDGFSSFRASNSSNFQRYPHDPSSREALLRSVCSPWSPMASSFAPSFFDFVHSADQILQVAFGSHGDPWWSVLRQIVIFQLP